MKLKWILFPVLVVVVSLLAAGCTGLPAPGEKSARSDLGTVTKQYRPDQQPLVLPELTADSSLSNYLAFALLNQPSVAEAYYDWAASVENITVTRSLPDPQFTFQAYIESSLTSLMPGLSQQIPGPGKLKVRGRAAAAASEGKYFTFESAVLQSAFALKTAYYKLGLLDEQVRLKRATLVLLENQERVVRAQNAAGAATLADSLRVQGELDRARNDLASLEDSRRPLLENFKAALGLTSQQPAPPVPTHFEFAAENLNEDELLRSAFARNPQLAAMAAEVRTAEAGIAVAYKERVPDFNAGLMAEVYKPPFYWPQVGMTLPVWRDKLAAEIAQAKANELAAQARWQSAQIELAVNFAQKSFAYRETGRNLALIENKLLPQAQQSLDVIRAGYRTGDVNFSSVISAERFLLDLQLGVAEARTQRAIALADLSLMVAGVPPPRAPLLTKTMQP
jgi:cobalt-zinc-cadmium efflux system outer membrane protein